MKSTTIFFLITLLLISTAVSASGIKKVDQPTGVPSFLGYVPDRLIVVMRSDAGDLKAQMSANAVVHIGEAEFDEISDRFEVSSIRKQFAGSQPGAFSKTAELAKYYKIQIEAGTLDEALEAYRSHPMVERVERVGIHTMHATPNDGFYDPYQWYHNQTSDDDIDSPEAWDLQTGSTSTVVAILDSGTRYYHRDLGGANTSPTNVGAARGNMWINNAELNGSSGVDDDGNGFTDDWIGWDFIETTSGCWDGEDCGTQDNDPRDFNGHGTHTAGIFGMLTNNGYGMAGVAGGWGSGSEQEYGNGVKVMPLRMGFSYDHWLYGEVGVVYMDAAAEAFYYAADNGADIASCSWGSSNSGGIAAAATYFLNSGGMIFVAAGNDGSQTANYLNGRGDCISVAATDENDAAASFTTYGTWVDISAPGVGIYSTYHDHSDPNVDYWASMDGTSMACPMAAGVAALIWSQNPGWTASQVESQLYSSAENIDSELSAQYIGKMGAGRINAYDAVNTGPPPPPVADFSGSPTSGTEPLTVDFTDLTTGSVESWSWTFGDGGTSTAQNPSYTYTSAGTYNVSLTATGPGGNDTETKNGYITVDPCVPPTAGFTGAPTSGEVPLNVNFTNSSTGATSCSWTFGDGGTSTATDPSYTYTVAGTYTVELTATNSCGSDVFTRIDYITVTCTAPTAGFVGSPTSGDYPLTVDFTDQSTGATSYSWTFGDGGTSTAANPSYTYTAAGTYTVTQTVTNSCGNDQLVRTDYITVTTPPPTADFSGTPTSGEAPLTVDLTDLSSGNPTSWGWDFGDGVGTSTVQNPSYTYNNAGSYTVTLTATNAYGSDLETKLDYITVAEPGVAEKAFAQSESTAIGMVTGSYANTFTSDNIYEVITEIEYTGHPVKRYSYLEHTWTFNVGGGSTVTFFLEAYRPSNSDGDDFVFEYSTDGVTFLSLVTVASGTEQVYQASLPAYTSGAVYVRVRDSNRSWGLISLDAVYVDQMYIEYESTPGPPVADFSGLPTGGEYPLTVNFTDLSTGSPTSWNWTFGDGGTSTAQNPSYEYTAAGTYTVSLTATNAHGSDVETKTGYITVTEPGVNASHVHNMTVGRGRSGPNSYGTCTVTIYDQANQALSGATVYVTYTGPTGGSLNGTTGADGTVSFQTTSIKKPSVEWCFEVTNVTHATHTYDPDANGMTYVCESGIVYGNGAARLVATMPQEFSLSQNYPNPFNPTTTIEFGLPVPSDVSLAIYNITGQLVTRVADGYYGAGIHTVIWNADQNASGVYFYRLETSDFVETKKMLLLK